MSIQRPQPISDRIAAWKQAYDAVLAEVTNSTVPPPLVNDLVKAMSRDDPYSIARWDHAIELAARTAATLAIGATTRERGE